jgi:tetratricopeptide (TPR) repeat protein
MSKEKTEWQTCINWRILVLFFLLIVISYSNSFSVPFHFDDFSNISENSRLHLDNLYPETIYDAAFKNKSGNRKLYRPVSNLSIAVNWYLGQSDVIGYHIFNISIHIFTAFFLYLTCVNLLKTPNLCRQFEFEEDKYFIAILTACLWALNPIQTQAVTYIVQRMAAMAAMFYIMGIYCYLKARFGDSWTKRLLWSLGVMIVFLLAVGSKENAIMFPISLLLVEMVFFQNMTNPDIRKKMMVLGSVVLFTVFVSGIWLFLSSEFINHILSGYENRSFTFSERLLTQPRIVVFYLSQIFYPISDRLSLDHDIVVSTGLFSPWTTFAAIVLIVGLISIAIWQIKKRPLLAFAILFFFLHHIIESSVIALELIFEHRNYLPSLFLFLPVAAGLKRGIDYYLKNRHSKIMGGMLIGFCVILIMMLGLGTYVRNMAWADAKTLWEDTIEKAPGRARAYQNLGQVHYEKIHNYDQILKLSEKAMYLAGNTRNKTEVISLANMANVYATYKKDYEKAIQLYHRILEIDPKNEKARYHLVLVNMRAGEIETAAKHIDDLLSKKPGSGIYLNLKALILLKLNHPETAGEFLKKAVSIAPDDARILLSLGTAKMLMGHYVLAEHYLKRVSGQFNNDMTSLLLLLENSIRSEDFEEAEIYADQLLSNFSTFKILNALEQAGQPNLQPPLSTQLITPVISKKLKAQSRKIQELANKDGA